MGNLFTFLYLYRLAASIVSNERPLTSDFLTCTRFPLSFSEYRAKADQNEKCCV